MKRQAWLVRAGWVLGMSTLAVPALAAKGPAYGQWSYHEVSVLGTSLDLVVTAEQESAGEAARSAALGEIERLRKILSAYDAGAELARVNLTREPVKVSQELLEVLQAYDAWRGRTHGAYSAGVGGLVKLWKQAEKEGKEPAAAALSAEVAAAAGAELWKIDAAGGTVQRLTDAQLNVDSLGKGFVTQRAAQAAMKVSGVEGVLLNIGGDVTALGTSVPGKKIKWTVKVADPRKPEANAPALTEVRVQDGAVATSGSYERGYTIHGKRLSHILDARTGRPVEMAARQEKEVIAATVIAPDNATANALATSLCVLPQEEGLALVKATEGAGCLLVLADGTKVKSELFKSVELQKNSTSNEQSTIAQAAGDRWPAGSEVKMTLQIKQASSRSNERPYVAVWVEDADGRHVKTLAMWGNQQRWLPEMTGWWKFAQRTPALASVSRATRPVGKYDLVWDGKDQAGKAVPVGSYRIVVETAFEHGGHVLRATSIVCDGAGESTVMEASNHFEPVAITYRGAKG